MIYSNKNWVKIDLFAEMIILFANYYSKKIKLSQKKEFVIRDKLIKKVKDFETKTFQVLKDSPIGFKYYILICTLRGQV